MITMKCERCGNPLTGTWWHIDVRGLGNHWHRLCAERRGFIEGLWAGLTDYTRCGDEMALVNHTGQAVLHHKPGGGIQVGMTTVPHRVRYAHLVSTVVTAERLGAAVLKSHPHLPPQFALDLNEVRCLPTEDFALVVYRTKGGP